MEENSTLALRERDVRKHPDNTHAILALGREYLSAARYDDAARTLRRYLALPTALWKEERCKCMQQLAECYTRLGNRPEAERWHLRACAEAPQNPSPWTNAAQFYAEAEVWDMVAALSARAVSITEKEQDAALPYALLSLACYSTGRKGDAEAVLGKACALFPQDTQLQESLRRLLQT
ncbi:MAG: tetratricopeptide repeat protein [Acutalibacteraceae bacterium]